MTTEKAKELFSDYHESKLEPSLRVTLEAKFKSDPTLFAEYKAFTKVWVGLGALPNENIDVPSALRSRIADRIDVAAARKPGFMFNLRQLAWSGMVAVAILGAVITFKANRGTVATAGVMGASESMVGTIDLEIVAGKPNLVVDWPGAHVISISDGTSHKEIKSISTNEQKLESPLTNPNESAGLIDISLDSAGPTVTVALPGKIVPSVLQGRGSQKDFALALAQKYGATVLIQGPQPVARLGWSLQGSISSALLASLPGSGLASEIRTDGVVVISAAAPTR